MSETLDIKVARLEEQMKMHTGKLDVLLTEVRQYNKMQAMVDRANQEAACLQTGQEQLQREVAELHNSIRATRAFAMGASAAFGFIGSALAFSAKLLWGR